MKVIRFVSPNSSQTRFASEVRKRVNTYFKENKISSKGNTAMFVKVVSMLFMYLAPLTILLTVSVPTWGAILLAVLIGIGEAGVGMSVMHDAAHHALSEKKWVNNLFASTMYLLGSTNFPWKVQHNVLHHTYTNIYGYDEDIETKAIIRLNEHAPVKKINRYQHLYAFPLYGLMTLSKIFTDIFTILKYNRDGLTRAQGASPSKEVFKLLITKIIYFFVFIALPIWVTDYTWWQVIIGFSIIHITAGIIMSTVFQCAHVLEATEQPLPDSNGIIHADWMVHQLHTTSDFGHDHRLLGWYVGGLNFQIEHHLFPNVCHIHYRKLAPIIRQTAEEFGLPYHQKPSFIRALLSHVRKLKWLGEPVPEKILA